MKKKPFMIGVLGVLAFGFCHSPIVAKPKNYTQSNFTKTRKKLRKLDLAAFEKRLKKRRNKSKNKKTHRRS